MTRSIRMLALGVLGLGLTYGVMPGCASREVPQTHPQSVQALMQANPPKFEPVPPSELVQLANVASLPYVLGVGDRVQVVSDAPFLAAFGETSKGDVVGTRIKSDGNIYLPRLGAVKAEGLTAVQLQGEIAKLASKYKKDPFVSVDLVENKSRSYYVFGAVNNPGKFFIGEKTRLLDAVSECGGIPDDGDIDQAVLARHSQLIPVNLTRLVQVGDLRNNVRIQDNDVLFVPTRKEPRVYVVGEVKKPGVVPIPRDGLSLVEAIAASGDVNRDFAECGMIRVFRGNWCQPGCYTVSHCDMMKAGASIQLKPGDRVLVGTSEMGCYARALKQIFPIIQTPINLATSAAAVSTAIGR